MCSARPSGATYFSLTQYRMWPLSGDAAVVVGMGM
jgi:hypothetical protein